MLVVEPDPARRTLAEELGLTALEPVRTTSPATIAERRPASAPTSCSRSRARPTGILAATRYAALRGRVVVVAIFPEPKPVALFDLFWKELELRGARVYEPEDFDAAIELIAAGTLELEPLITAVEPLQRVPAVFDELSTGRPAMKILVDCQP